MTTVAQTGRFPDDFWWGAATASYQIEGAVHEGGRGPSIWDTFSHTPGKVLNGDTGDVADDHYHRVPGDVELMGELNLDAYRFSVAWPRIMPTGTGQVNPEGLAFYSDLVDRLLEAGIAPVATLYHWDLPQALEDQGGWGNRATAYAFGAYARVVAEALGDRVAMWTTLNEPWCSAYLGYASGEHAPGVQDPATALAAVHHLNLAHGLAARAIRGVLGEDTPVSITLNLQMNYTVSDSPEDQDAKRRADGVGNEVFLQPLLEGVYPADVLADTADITDWSFVHEGDLEIIRQPLDALGINYYTPGLLKARTTPLTAEQAAAPSAGVGLAPYVEHVDQGAPVTAMGWHVDPGGLTDLLLEVAGRYPDLSLMVTENGAAYDGDEVTVEDGRAVVRDPERVRYLHDHVTAVGAAIDAGADVVAYFVWSFMDNFEWALGYSKRFGVIHVDYDTQVRTVKDSGRWWGELAASGVIPPAAE